ncbi:permease [Arthrobacter sp. MYb211]|uniref:GntP family permease n=1 Tax=Micrococcaceae TaxID=1268 RepID=UPI000CFD9251|nr:MULTISPECIES: gluconate:H+ symporter [unclassified Arthrobacter]PRA04440.1 permease [Arthrobacter sp. MYb229]PRA12177.1 permease [Arthrobacter sp. MYb221]PRB51647.1 permease [Arthrobacter sp. MYb216]PRC08640.1 permease [Arthrobacter sp. MYb211]
MTSPSTLVLAAAAAPEATLPVPVLLLIAVLAIAVLLFLIMKVRLHAFFSLIIVSLLTAIAAGVSAADLLETIVGPFGKTLGNVAMLVGFGAVLGRIVETSGGAQVISEKLIGLFGEKRAPLALSVASLLFGFPIFLDAGFIVMLPIIYTVARRVGGGLLKYALPAAGAFLVMHALVPPHPGPVAAAGIVGADVGLVLMVGLLVGLPTWYVAGYRLSLLLAARTQRISVPELLGTRQEADQAVLPRFALVLSLLLLPLVLIFMNTGIKTLQATGVVPEDALWAQILVFLGNTPIALLISALLAMYLLLVRPHEGPIGSALEKVVDDSLAPVCSIILITGAGGIFGGVLTATGIGGAMASSLQAVGMPLILAGFLIAVIMRVAQGSATVAGTTAAGLMAPAVAASGDQSPLALACIVVAIVAGAITLSHVNDSGFWLVSRFLGLSTKTALSTWTVIATAVGVMSFALCWLLYVLVA